MNQEEWTLETNKSGMSVCVCDCPMGFVVVADNKINTAAVKCDKKELLVRKMLENVYDMAKIACFSVFNHFTKLVCCAQKQQIVKRAHALLK